MRSWPYGVKIEEWANCSSQRIEADSLSLNSLKARNLLKWSPIWTQEEAVIATFRWWHEILNLGFTPIKSCNEEIEQALTGLAHMESV